MAQTMPGVATIPAYMQLDLPIYDLRDTLRAAWTQHNRLVLIAPTGSGKTTQVCQMLLADAVMPGKRIVVLQPRRVAARSVARRVADELGSDLGGVVGYQVRFDERLSPSTKIAFVTEGILLRWLERDRTLGDIGAVLFDEFHERNLLSDVALAVCKQLQQTSRPDLRLIIMSATLEARPVAAYLGHCPILESQGRSFPVEIHFQTWGDDSPVWERAAQQTVDILRTTQSGDVLVFMPGMFEIQRTIDEIRQLWRTAQRDHPRTDRPTAEPPVLLALHGEMPARDQDRAFAPSPYRRVIVATNVAETSITLPGIQFVVDSGLARIARYDPTRGVNTLHIEPISHASADQRAGRAGRIGPGVCYRLWSLDQHLARPVQNTPEVARTELSSIVLLLRSLGVRQVEQFDFLDKPDPERIRAAETLLASLGAVTPEDITATGQRMLSIPAHPRYARMLIEAQHKNCVRDVALLAALMSGRDILMRLGRDDKLAKRNRDSLLHKSHKQSDYFLWAKAFVYAHGVNFDGRACSAYGIHAHTAREVAQTFRQLQDVCVQAGLVAPSDQGDQGDPDGSSHPGDPGDPRHPDKEQPLADPARVEAIGQCHLVGFVDHLAVRTSTGSDDYDLSGGRRCTLTDESVVGQNMIIVASEIREITTRSGERLALLSFCSAVKLDWLRALNPPGLHERVEHIYDRLNKRVAVGRVVRYHDLILGGERLPESAVDLTQASHVLAEAFADHLDKLPQWSRLKPMLAARQPALSREQIVDRLDRSFQGATTTKEALARDVLAAFSTS